jgi:hypothetical protein
MQAVLKIEDWVPGTARQQRPALRLVSEALTLGELIAQRITADCRAFKAAETAKLVQSQARLAPWMVVPGASEQTLNGAGRVFGPGVPAKPNIDADAQIRRARQAFEDGRFVVLFDGAQIDGWDQRITVRDGSIATFIELTPLKSG